MEELLKKLVYGGIGLANVAADKLNETLDELVEKGKLSDSEAKQVADDFFTKTEARRDEFEEKLRSVGEEIVNRLDFLKNVDFMDINKRLEELETRLTKERKQVEKKVREVVVEGVDAVAEGAKAVEKAAKDVKKTVNKRPTAKSTRTKAKGAEVVKDAK
jgi:polyhydroxyalkanoate synthesis regulator phasin